MKVSGIKTKLFVENDDLVAFIKKAVPTIKANSILAVTAKVVSLSEGRTAPVEKREALIKSASKHHVKTKYVWLTHIDGLLMANAGIDDSNGNGKLVLLPKDSMKTANALYVNLKKYYKLKNFGVLITDSNPSPLRAGVVGVALGYAGFKPVRDYRGKKDLFGRKFTFSQTNIADSLATAANVVMGEGAEQEPLVVITNAPVVFTKRVNKKELAIAPEDDMYAPLLKGLTRKKK